jgi:peptidoglycan-associated lipoprotein
MAGGVASAAVMMVLSACSSVPAPVSEASPATSAVYVRHPHVSKVEATPARPAREPEALRGRRTIYFDFDSDQIRPLDLVLVQAHAQYMMAHPGARLRIEGHADERGGSEYNLALGQRRAEVVRLFMVNSGVSELALEAVSLGEEMPVDPAHNEAAWALNRRAELRYLSR